MSIGINIYHMQYKNQLVLTGEINDVGAYRRANIDESYRKGIEVEGFYKITKMIWSGNLTLSENKIIRHTEFIDNWDTWGQVELDYENTDLTFSNIIWASIFNYQLNDEFNIDLISKYVGEQFIDNTSSKDRMLNDYLVNHLRLSYNWKNKIFKTTKITMQINSLFDTEYVSNAWVYRFISENWDPRSSDPYVNQDSQRGYTIWLDIFRKLHETTY